MRYILIILVFLSVGADAQMVIKAHANYRPYAAAVSGNLLLDDYPNAAAAYSLRKLDKDYAGAAIRVRKDTTGQPEQDIGFTADGNLDTTALKNFVLNNSAFVTTWYNQSDSSGVYGVRNATQSTSTLQPRIVNAGVVERIGGEVAIRYDGSDDNLTILGTTATFKFFHDGTTSSIYIVAQSRSQSSSSIFGNNNASANVGYFIIQNNAYAFNSTTLRGVSLTQSSLNQTTNNQILNSQYLLVNELDADNATAANRNSIYVNNGAAIKNNIRTSAVSTANATTNFNIGRLTPTFTPHIGSIQEIIIYNTDRSADRTNIQTNINTYYSIY